MDEDKAKLVKIIISVACVVIAVVLFFVFNGSSGGSGKVDINTKYILCDAEECGASQKFTKEEYYDFLRESGVDPRTAQYAALPCPECGEETAYKANKCPKCQTIFLYDPEAEDYKDRCPNPDCGYSWEEERIRNLK
ncbi:MAG: hypothetical protein FVQ80_10070 [Planctomycetes bacterium]|nr:hypothetical protein [Planctomycetota bacterium]